MTTPRILGPVPRNGSRDSVAGDSEPMLVNLREPLAVLRRHLWMVLGITALVTAVIGYRAYIAVPTYRAAAVIRLSNPRHALTGGVAEGPSAGIDARSADPLLSQVELIQSRTVAAVVVDSMPILRIRTVPFARSLLRDVALADTIKVDSLVLQFGPDSLVVTGRAEQVRTIYGAPVELDGIRFSVAARPQAPTGVLRLVSREAALGRVIGGLQVTPRPRTDVIDVAYSATDPTHAQQVANRVVQVYRAVNADEGQRQSRLRREFLETQLRVNDSVLAAARSALTAFRRRAGRVGSEPAAASRQAGADQLQLQREQLDADRRMYLMILASLDTVGGRGNREALRTAASAPGIGVSALVGQAFGQLVQYENTRDSLLARSPTHPDLLKLSQQISTGEVKLLGAVRSAVRGLIASLDVRIASLDELWARRTANVEHLSDTDAEEARLEERVANARTIADDLRSEYQRARIAEAVEVGQVEIVDLAVRPGAPLGIGFVQKATLGLLLGLVLGVGSAFLTDHLRSSIGRREEIEALGMPVLSAVPRSRDTRAAGQTAGPAIEAFRGLRLSIVHAYGTAGPVVFAVSSPGSRDGKSFVASNLALAFAHANYRTLLIDGDARRGTLHRVLGAARKPGLIDFLAGDVPPTGVIQTTKFRPLQFIPCGVRRPDAPELLASGRMSDLFAYARANFGVIIVDTAPLGAGVDAFALATITGHLLMVLRPGMTDRHVVEAKLDQLERLPVRILGAVLNDVREGPEYRAYSYYLEGYDVQEEAVRKHPTLLRSER